MTLIEYYEKNLKENQNKIFIKYKETELSYIKSFEIIKNYRKIINDLKEDIIAIDVENSDILVLIMLACIYEKQCYYIISKNTPDKRKEYIFNQLKIKKCITLDKHNNINIINIQFDNSNNNLPNNIDISKIAQIIFTSGSTGKPKGVCLTYDNFNNFAEDIEEYFDFTDTEGFISIADTSFDMFVSEVIISIVKNKTLYIVNYENLLDIKYIADLIKTNNIENILTTPSKIDILINSEFTVKSILKNILLGGEKISKKILDSLIDNNIKIFNLYGPTETTFHCLREEVKNIENILLGSPVKNTEVMIMDENGQLNNIGKGKLVIIGSSVSDGYFAENNNNFFEYNGKKAFLTSDIVNIDKDYNIKYIDREESIFKINGQRISFDEIEDAILNCSNINFIKVVYYDNQIIALYKSNNLIDINTIKNSLTEYIPQFMIPNKFYKIDDFKINQSGKTDYIKTIKEIENNEFYEFKESNQIENQLISISQKILNRSIREDLSFTENGGNSLSAMRVSMELRSKNILISVKDLLKNIPIKNILNEKDTFSEEKNIHNNKKYMLSSIQRLMLKNNQNIDHFTTHHIFKLNKNISKKIINDFFNFIIEKYDGLRMYYDKTENCLSLCENFNFQIKEIYIDNIDTNNITNIIYNLSKECTVNKFETFVVAKLYSKNETYLVMLLHHFFSDALSWKIIHDELDLYFNKGINLLKSTIKNSYSEYLLRVEEKINTNSNNNNNFISKIIELENYDFENKKFLYNILNYKKFIFEVISKEVIDEFLFYSSITFALSIFNNKKNILFEIEDNGRKINNEFYYDTIGWHTCPFNIILEYDNKISKNENIKYIKSKVLNYKKHAIELSNKKTTTDNDFLSIDASIVLNFLGNIADIENEFEIEIKENLLVPFDIYIVGFYKNDKFIINFKYNDNYSENDINYIANCIRNFLYETK